MPGLKGKSCSAMRRRYETSLALTFVVNVGLLRVASHHGHGRRRFALDQLTQGLRQEGQRVARVAEGEELHWSAPLRCSRGFVHTASG